MRECFDKRLLDHIEHGRNDEAKAMLDEELARAFDHSNFCGTLLHHAVNYNNAVIAKRLIELGANVDRFGGRSTPLMMAVKFHKKAVVQVLLEANARIDVVDDDGSSALQLGLHWIYINTEIFKLLTEKLRTQAGTKDEVAEILIRAGCNMCHAVILRDIDVMECMLKRGVDVNSKIVDELEEGTTALHITVELNDTNLAEWLLKKGADVDAYDERAKSALEMSVVEGTTAMVQLLLEHGACPDVNDGMPLFQTIQNYNIECAELLLHHGASYPNPVILRAMCGRILFYSDDRLVKLLIAHMTMLEMLGKPVVVSVIMDSANDRHQAEIPKLWKYHESCQKVLTIQMFEKLTLLDFLNESDRKMRMLIRNETFLQEVERVSSEHELKILYSYYYNSMMWRIEKAKRVVTLEYEGILVICKIFEANYNQFYDFARGVVEYLRERDLERLVQV